MITFEKDGITYKMFDHLFAVSECGKVLRKFAPTTPHIRPDGYLELGRRRLMHRVVAFCWIPNPTNAKHVHHKNGNKADNRAENLEWITPQDHCKEHEFGSAKNQYTRTPESIAKFIASRTGVKDSAESAAVKRANLDKVRPSTECKFQGITYPSVASAARAAGIPAPTFRVRAISKNFPEYEIIRCYYS
jgi:hypothetical protein